MELNDFSIIINYRTLAVVVCALDAFTSFVINGMRPNYVNRGKKRSIHAIKVNSRDASHNYRFSFYQPDRWPSNPLLAQFNDFNTKLINKTWNCSFTEIIALIKIRLLEIY